ncbi:G-protein coupled receptor GRL101-like [Littorina saxatilis]|uniref:G-protein coupled receptor GRL101-like n=1 Tax=Littorina saxatilis TaxID=31220 RepID=UPI0038B5C220
MAPLMLYDNEMEITFPFIEECFGVLSKFNFSYQTHPLHSLPNTYRQIEGHDAYNCDGMINLPEAISCDGIRHCTQGEDEENCPYREEGCGDWYPYKDQCLKAIFIDYQLRTMPGVLEAEEACQQQHGATLAALTDLAGQRVMADMAVKSGRDSIAVGIKKVQPVSIRLSQLYRFLWQWGPRGSPIAYEQQQLQNDGTLEDCAVLKCRYGRPIHYSLVCDGKDDCLDRSDEMDCQRPRFSPLLDSSYICRNFQAVPVKKRCDGMIDCLDGSDEEFCVSCEMKVMCPGSGCLPYKYIYFVRTCPLIYPIALVTEHGTNLRTVELDGYGMSSLKPSDTECGEGFYQCLDGFCIPTFLLNNGEQDCPNGEDEGIPVNSVTCPGYYRCQEVGTCVHKNYTCDGIHHCPYKDDELFCDLTCPHDGGCVCEGQAYTCSKMIDPLQHLHLRYLDLSSASNVSLENLHFLEYLVFLNLSFCRLVNVTLGDMPQLQTLDLSSNLLTHLSSLNLTKLPGLIFLDVSHNPLAKTLGKAFGAMINVGELLNLKSLIFVNVSLQAIENRAFSSLSKLKYLDVRTNPLHGYKKESLYGLVALEQMFTDETKLCCSYFHSTVSQCHAPVDELSSCSDLLAQGVFKAFLWTLSGLAIVGNVGVLVYRAVVKTQTVVSASDILVKSLCASDLLMGVYLMMIGVADAQLSGRYVAEENEWKGSVMCTVAGFLSLVSTEVSALMVCLITLERVLVLCFPFRAQLHFSPRVALLLCLGTWITGVMLASVPLLASLEFYGQTSICIPLPITRQQFSGQQYAFGIFIVFNFVVFLFIGAGQLLIYRAVNKASASSGAQRRSQEMKVARRLFLIILTDFCCWFPIGVMGLLAARGVRIPAVINVWAAIFVLPLNSALNPFLYTLNGLLERVKKQRKQKRMKKMLGSLQKEIPTWKRTDAQELIKICVRSGAVDKTTVAKILGITIQSLSNGNNCFTGHGDNADCHVSMEVSNTSYEPDNADMTQDTQNDSQL